MCAVSLWLASAIVFLNQSVSHFAHIEQKCGRRLVFISFHIFLLWQIFYGFSCGYAVYDFQDFDVPSHYGCETFHRWQINSCRTSSSSCVWLSISVSTWAVKTITPSFIGPRTFSLVLMMCVSFENTATFSYLLLLRYVAFDRLLQIINSWQRVEITAVAPFHSNVPNLFSLQAQSPWQTSIGGWWNLFGKNANLGERKKREMKIYHHHCHHRHHGLRESTNPHLPLNPKHWQIKRIIFPFFR
jgi:hypothetical protein